VASFIMTEASEKEYFKHYVKIPVFDAPENAMRAFHLSHEWSSRRPLPLLKTRLDHIDEAQAGRILDEAKESGTLLLSQGIDLIKSYGFAAARHGLAATAEEAVHIWRSWNRPVAMKVNRPHLSHKSDQGAVKLNIQTEAEIHSAFKDLQRIAGPGLEVLVQEMAPKGREIILGGKRDDCFGPVVLFGLGGIFVEVFRDAVWRLAPVQHEEAGRMIRSIQGARVLSGYRGESPRDVEALKDLLVRLSQMLVTFPQIQEIDINPVMVMAEGEGALAVDARVILK
jgi:acyl-CoA synthetase (NDP forming)